LEYNEAEPRLFFPTNAVHKLAGIAPFDIPVEFNTPRTAAVKTRQTLLNAIANVKITINRSPYNRPHGGAVK
jgi:hypothetical protein